MNKKKKSQKKQQSGHAMMMGKLDLTFKIDFNDEDLVEQENNENGKEEGNEKKLKNIEDIKELSQLSFIQNNKKLINRIKLTSQKDILKLLVLGSKNSEKNSQIEYICYTFPKFMDEKETFFNDILKSITKKHGLLLNENSIIESGDYTIKIMMSHK